MYCHDRMTWLYSPHDHTILHDSAGNTCRIAACMHPPEQDSTVYAAEANGAQSVCMHRQHRVNKHQPSCTSACVAAPENPLTFATSSMYSIVVTAAGKHSKFTSKPVDTTVFHKIEARLTAFYRKNASDYSSQYVTGHCQTA